VSKKQTLEGHCNKTIKNVNFGFYAVSVLEYFSMGRIVLPASLDTTEWQADKPGLVNHKDKRCEYNMRHCRKTLFNFSPHCQNCWAILEFKSQKN
jgi:hypothetical protein